MILGEGNCIFNSASSELGTVQEQFCRHVSEGPGAINGMGVTIWMLTKKYLAWAEKNPSLRRSTHIGSHG